MPLSQVLYYLHHVCMNFCLYLQMIWYLNLNMTSTHRQETLCTCHGPTSCTATPSWRRPLTAWPLLTWTTTPLSWTSSLNGESHSRPRLDSSSTCSWNLHRSGLGWQMLRIRWELGDDPISNCLLCFLSGDATFPHAGRGGARTQWVHHGSGAPGDKDCGPGEEPDPAGRSRPILPLHGSGDLPMGEVLLSATHVTVSQVSSLFCFHTHWRIHILYSGSY